MSKNAPDIHFFESFANEIEGKLGRVKNLVAHRASSGDYHEEILRTILRNFLTKRFSVKKGFIFKSSSEVSNQIDIMIIDETSPVAYLFQEGDFAIVAPEAVIAVVEVKTTLNAPEFISATKNIASAKRLVTYPTSLRGIVFGYSGTTPSNSNLDKWFKRKELMDFKMNHLFAPDSYMFFSDGLLLARHEDQGKFAYGGKYYHKLFRDDTAKEGVKDRAWQLSIIFALILAVCEDHDAQQRSRFSQGVADRFISSDGSMKSHERFSFGDGISKILPMGNEQEKKS